MSKPPAASAWKNPPQLSKQSAWAKVPPPNTLRSQTSAPSNSEPRPRLSKRSAWAKGPPLNALRSQTLAASNSEPRPQFSKQSAWAKGPPPNALRSQTPAPSNSELRPSITHLRRASSLGHRPTFLTDGSALSFGSIDADSVNYFSSSRSSSVTSAVNFKGDKSFDAVSATTPSSMEIPLRPYNHTRVDMHKFFQGASMQLPPQPSQLAMCIYKLQQFDPYVSHQADPSEWARLNIEHVTSIAQTILQPESATCPSVYPRLTLYTMARIMSYPEKVKFLDTTRTWKAWDDIAALANHQIVKNYLMAFLNTKPGIQSDYREAVQTLLDIDVIAIDALLLETVQNRTKCKSLVARRGQEGQSLLNLLQARLNFPLNASHKRFYVDALIKLSRASGLYPECLILKEITTIGVSAVDGGSYGDVWKGSLEGKEIALKVLKIYKLSNIRKLLKDFASEAVTWRQLCHPNVLPFFGVYHWNNDSNRVCLAAPWMNNGNIVQFLEMFPETHCIPLVRDIAEGLRYLHEQKPHIIHGDLKGANILVTNSRRACLADFGLATAQNSRSLLEASTATHRSGGTLRWQAPELLDPDDEDGHNSFASDVYAYACVCYEIFSGQIPFHEFKIDYRIILAVTTGRRPPRPSHDLCHIRGLDNGMWDIIESCWVQEPNDRLSAHQIVDQLNLLPGWTVDERPLDDFSPLFPSQTLYSQAEHPFSSPAFLAGKLNELNFSESSPPRSNDPAYTSSMWSPPVTHEGLSAAAASAAVAEGYAQLNSVNPADGALGIKGPKLAIDLLD